MGKLSQAEMKAHTEAEAVLRQDVLSEDEEDFVLENWRPGAENNAAAVGVFFTLMDLALTLPLSQGVAG